jgi:phosphoribosylformylglycinamidine synthase
LPPYGGVTGGGPNDAVLLTPLLGKPYAAVIAHGINPVLNKIDAYWGSIWAATEAVANAVAVGADPCELALIDNFIWPVPEGSFLAFLDRAVDACADFSRALEMPFISGKDSLSSTYKGGNKVIHIPPVLCVSAFGRLPDVQKTVSTDFKGAGHTLVIVGDRVVEEMGGSVYYELLGHLGKTLPRVKLQKLPGVLRAVHRAITGKAVLACHDVSEGGLMTAVAEMGFGGGLGAVLRVPENVRPDFFLFNETPGCFVVELSPGADPGELFGDAAFTVIGQTTPETVVSVYQGDELFTVALDRLYAAYTQPLKEVFGA